MDFQPCRTSRRWCQYPIGEALRKDLTPAQDSMAPEAAGDHQELFGPPESGRSATRRRFGYGRAGKQFHTMDTHLRFRTPEPQ